MRTFVVGDIHGAHKALLHCLDRCGIDRENDLLITLGDICDGWAYVYECVEELLTIKNRIDIIGNHDNWFKIWLETSVHRDLWYQGGKGTAVSYLRQIGREDMIIKIHGQPAYETSLNPYDVPPAHHQFFKNQVPYFLDNKKRLFVHAGFGRHRTLKEQQRFDPSDFYWNRELWTSAMSTSNDQRLTFKESLTEIFIGHTATTGWTTKEIKTESGIVLPRGVPITTPMHADIIWNLDTGAGWYGKLTIMDVDTHEYWQSDLMEDLYTEPNSRG